MITTTVATKTWCDNGGTGSLSAKGNLLCVNQTFQIQCEVKALLDQMRAKQQAAPTVVVELQGLWLDGTQYKQLLGDGGKPSNDGRVQLAVDAKSLDALGQNAPGFRGRIICANGQLVHLASGDRRAVVVNAIPVIDNTVGYSPTVQIPNIGIVVEVRPTVAPRGTSANLDVQSVVTRWGKPQPTVRVGASWSPKHVTEGMSGSQVHEATSVVSAGSASCPVERPILPTQDWATTVRVPLGKPVLLGGITFASAESAGLDKPSDNSLQLYLIATTSTATACP